MGFVAARSVNSGMKSEESHDTEIRNGGIEMSRGNGSGLEKENYGTSDTINDFQGETEGHGLDSGTLTHENLGGNDSGIEHGAANDGSGMNSGTKDSPLGMRCSNISLRG